MDKLAVIGMAVGFTWGTAGVLGYPGLSWKPGAIMMVAALLWLVAHDATPPEPLIEAGAIIIFIALSVARDRLYPAEREEKAKGK